MLKALAVKAGMWLATKGAGGWFNVVAPGHERTGEFVDAYSQSLYAMAGINKIGRNLASARLDVHADEKGGKSAIQNDLITRWKARPAVGLKWSQFIEATNLYLKSDGHFFWLMGDEWLIPHPDERRDAPPLILADPTRMTPQRSGGQLLGWTYRDDGHTTHSLLPENVIRTGYFNRSDRHAGMSPLKAAMIAVEANFYAGRFFRNAMKSNGERGSIISARTGGLSEPQETQIKATLERHARMRAAGDVRPLFMSGEVQVHDPQVMTIDASFFEGSRLTGEQIFLALDLPPSMAGKFESNSIGSASDYYRMLTDAVIPTGDLICDAIDEALARLTGQTVFASFNLDDHPIMQEVREGKTDAATKYWAMGMPFKDVSQFLKLGAPRFEGDDVGYMPFSVAPVGAPDFGDPANDPATGETEDEEEEDEGLDADEDVQAMFAALKGVASLEVQSLTRSATESSASAAHDCGCGCGNGLPGELLVKAPRLSPADRAAWARQMKLRKPFEKKTVTAFRRELMTARAEVLANINAAAGAKSLEDVVFKGAAADLMFNLSSWKSGLLRRMRKVSAETLQEAGEEEWRILEQTDPFKQPTPFVDQFLRSRENFIAGAADNVFRSVTRQLEAGVSAGESMAKLAGRVRAQFNQIADSGALRIARTEVGHAFEAARDKAQKDAGVQYHKWLTTGNDNVRASHAAANGQIVPIDEPFTVGGYKMKHPLDGSLGAPIGEIANCNCIKIAVRKPR